MRGWEDINLRECLSRRFHVPVYVEHDANAGVLAEWWYGQHNLEKGTYIYIAVGYGVGAGIIVDGKIFHGASGVAGEFGHMSINFHGPRCVCGNRGCLEMYASSYAVAKAIAKDKVINQSTKTASTCDFDSILEAYQQGNPLAVEVVQKAGEYLELTE